MDRRRALGVGLVLVAGVSFASGSVLATLAYRTGLDWLNVMWWRFLVGALLAWGWVLWSPQRRAGLVAMPRRQVGIALGLGTVYAGNAGTYYAGLETVPAALAGVLVYVYPVIVALLSLRFATRLPGRRPYLALLLAVGGVALTVGGLDVGSGVPLTGLLLILASATIYSVWIVLSARLSGERRDRLGAEAPDTAEPARDAAVTTALMMAATAAVFGSLSVVSGHAVDPWSVPPAAWPFLVGIGALASFLAIQTLYAGARRIGAAQAALISTTEPVFIIALSYAFLGQSLGALQLLGAALILIAVLVAQTSPRPRGAPEPATPLEAEGGAAG
jgi:drug/metabolite transporter (DMT)-like permease